MPSEQHREGDERPAKSDPEVSLTLRPAHDQPLRWKPKHGEPLCILEWVSQKIVRAIPPLTLGVAVVSLVLQVAIVLVLWGPL